MKDILNTFMKQTQNLKNKPTASAGNGVKHHSMIKLEPYFEQLSLFQPVMKSEAASHPSSDKKLRLRLAVTEDLERIVELEKRGYDGYLAWTLDDFERDWQKNVNAVYMVLEECVETPDFSAPLVGLVTGRFLLNRTHISHLIVDPAWQGYGLGSLLLEHWMETSRLLKKSEITLEVRESNHRAQQLYYKYGFVLASRKYFYYYDNDETALYLRCRLGNGAR